LQFVRSVLIKLHPSLHFWKAIKISLLLVVVLLNFNVYSHTYEHLKAVQVSSIHFSGLLIPSSSPHRFSEENLHICNTFEKILIFIYGKICQVCFYEVPHYCDNQVQFVILLNM
jgi:hypothetical protein